MGGETDPGPIAVDHLLQHDRHGPVALVGPALAVFAGRGRPVGRPADADRLDHRIEIAHIEGCVVEAGERTIRRVLADRRGANGEAGRQVQFPQRGAQLFEKRRRRTAQAHLAIGLGRHDAEWRHARAQPDQPGERGALAARNRFFHARRIGGTDEPIHGPGP